VRPASPPYDGLGRWLLAAEAAPGEQPPGEAAAERACSRLQEGLNKLVGQAGFDALMRRALHLVQREYPFLQGVQSFDGTCFVGLAERAAGQDPAKVSVAMAAVIDQFFSLLSSFIGEDLANRQVRRIWPDVPLSGAVPGAEEAAR
jgi:hypothetical protein